MFKRSNNNARKKGKPFKSDVTVYSYAHTEPGFHTGLREKKGDATKHIKKKEIQEEKMSDAKTAEDLSWFDKDLDDFDITVGQPSNEEEQIDSDCSEQTTPRNVVCSAGEGKEYPVDLWFQLSRFIHPESVATFALLCRATSHVVHSAQFWKNMYLRFYVEKNNIPENLRMSSVECIHGLRARTIRMLHFVYPPLVSRTRTTVPFENEPHRLVGQRCLIIWHRKLHNCWKFYLKFCKGSEPDLSSNKSCGLKSSRFLRWHQDLFYNEDNNMSILEVTCPSFSPMPMVMGLILNKVYFNVSSGSMRYHRLKLVMDSNYRATTAKNQGCMQELVFDPVLEVKVFPWWHPSYAEVQYILCESEM